MRACSSPVSERRGVLARRCGVRRERKPTRDSVKIARAKEKRADNDKCRAERSNGTRRSAPACVVRRRAVGSRCRVCRRPRPIPIANQLKF